MLSEMAEENLFGSPETFVKRRVQRISEEGTNNHPGKVKYIFYRLFPKYETLKHMYPVLRKAPILLPGIYCHRLFRIITHRERVKNEVRALEQWYEKER